MQASLNEHFIGLLLNSLNILLGYVLTSFEHTDCQVTYKKSREGDKP